MAPLRTPWPPIQLPSPSQTLCLLLLDPTFAAACCGPPSTASTYSHPQLCFPVHLPELKCRSGPWLSALLGRGVQAGSGDSSGEFSQFLAQVFLAWWGKNGQSV